MKIITTRPTSIPLRILTGLYDGIHPGICSYYIRRIKQINDNEELAAPAINTSWQHKNGNIYKVESVANEDSTRLDEYPVTVVYRRIVDESLWCRPLSRWHGSMTFIPSTYEERMSGIIIKNVEGGKSFSLKEKE